jgi:hypothetical protein
VDQAVILSAARYGRIERDAIWYNNQASESFNAGCACLMLTNVGGRLKYNPYSDLFPEFHQWNC